MRAQTTTKRSFAFWPALGLVTLLTLGCYNPKIEDGAFLCGSGNECPEGFSCIDMRCYKAGSPGDGGASDTGGGTDARQCTPASGSTGACDPVCQTGCRPVEQQCSNNGSSNLCRAATPNGEQLYGACDPIQDACRPGLVCLPEFTPETCGAHCYRFCRQDEDCGQNSRCVGEVSDAGGKSLYKTCSPRGFNCNPTGTNARCGDGAPPDRRFPAFGCYIVSPQYPDETVCECAGILAVGDKCERTYECVPGAECIPLSPTDVKCRRLCTPPLSPTQPVVACDLGQTCVPFARSNKIGFCQ
jgi:hypothetical protein